MQIVPLRVNDVTKQYMRFHMDMEDTEKGECVRLYPDHLLGSFIWSQVGNRVDPYSDDDFGTDNMMLMMSDDPEGFKACGRFSFYAFSDRASLLIERFVSRLMSFELAIATRENKTRDLKRAFVAQANDIADKLVSESMKMIDEKVYQVQDEILMRYGIDEDMMKRESVYRVTNRKLAKPDGHMLKLK